MGILEDRGKGLEAEYFHRQNQEAIAKLRQKMAVAKQAKEEGASSMQCPRCNGLLKENLFDGVHIDTCDQCAGVWLDASELEQLVSNDKSGWLSGLWNSFLHE